MISVIIPAYREADRIGATLSGVRAGARTLAWPVEVIVVDDGSDDGTAERVMHSPEFDCVKGNAIGEPASPRPDRARAIAVGRSGGHGSHDGALRLLRRERNQGKGAAIAHGLAAARGELIVLLDADLGETAAEFPCLVAPILCGEADLTIAIFPRTSLGGFGLVLRTARWGVSQLTGCVLTAPLSGQRALRSADLPLLTPLEPGFGLEVGIDVDALRAGLRVVEVPTHMAHAAMGRSFAGFRHRGRQLLHIAVALWRRRRLKGPGCSR